MVEHVEHQQASLDAHAPIGRVDSANLPQSSSTTTLLIDSDNPNAESPNTVSTNSSPLSPRQIRFNDHCVLIPECGRKATIQPPRIVTKDVPITLRWRWPPLSPARQKQQELDSEDVPECSNSAHHVLLKVPYPTFKRGKSLSTSRKVTEPLAPCLVQHCDRSGFPRPLTKSMSYSEVTTQRDKDRGRPQTPTKLARSASLPPHNFDLPIETVPLRPCCESCFSNCDLHNSFVDHPISSVSTPQSAYHTCAAESIEDWCDGLKFTKGALRLRRKARVEYGAHTASEAANLLGALVNVDEVDRKRNTPPPTPPQCSGPMCTLNMKDFDRIRSDLAEKKRMAVAEEDSGEDLFPLPSPKRSPANSTNTSPFDSASFLPGQVSQSGNQPLDKALKVKLKTQELEGSSESKAADTKVCTSYRPNHQDIVYDPSLPDPDTLPESSTVFLDSPSSSPRQELLGSPKDTIFFYSQRRAASVVDMRSTRPKSTKPRSGSLSGIMHAGAGVLRGINLVTSPSARGTAGHGMVL